MRDLKYKETGSWLTFRTTRGQILRERLSDSADFMQGVDMKEFEIRM